MHQSRKFNFTVVYDNNPFNPELNTDWGFSCFIEGAQKNILFDTGNQGEILLSNMQKLGISPQKINIVFLSHSHKDHIGGLASLLKENPNITVFLPDFFPKKFKKSIKNLGASYQEVHSYQKILENVYTTGVIKGWIHEQSLILESNKGLILITACAHPRIVNIIRIVKELTKKEIYMIFGGFHLTGFENHEIEEIIRVFKEQNVEKAGPCHCSGKEARDLFKQAYGKNYIHIGVGKKITI